MYLLDTSIVVFVLRGDPTVAAHLREHREDAMALSVVTLMELYYGARKSQNPESNLAKVRRIERAFEVVLLGPECAETFGSLKARLESEGQRLEDFDLAIAAVALAHNFVLATGNEKHFRRIKGLKIENWTV